jgi:Flp pilus assembly protein TadD
VHAAAVPSGLRIAARRRRLTLTLGLVALSAVVAGWAALRGHGGHPGSESNDLSMKLYERGRIEELNRSPLGIEAAKSAYRSAIEHDSTFALGYTGLAGVYGFIADYALGPAAPALDSARIMALRAVALDSLLPEAHTALAVSLGDGGQFAAAEREFLRAIDLGPKNAHAHYWYSIFLVALGRGADALRESERALSLDSIRPRGMLAMQRNAQWLLTGKRPYLQRPVLERRPVLRLDPGEPWARGREAIEFAQERRCAEAQSSIARAQQLAPNNIRTLSFLGQVYWRCGEQARARTLVDEMKKRPDANDHGIRIAVLYALFGEKDSAFVWLDHHRWTLSALAALSADYEEDSLRSDPRFGVLMRRIGIR